MKQINTDYAPWPAPYVEVTPDEVGNPWGDEVGDHVAAFLIFGFDPEKADLSKDDPYEAGVVVERWKYRPALRYTANGKTTTRPAIPGEVYYLMLNRDEYVDVPDTIAARLADWMRCEQLLPPTVEWLTQCGLEHDNIDDAAKWVQDFLGVTDGGLAGMMLSDDDTWREDFADYVEAEFNASQKPATEEKTRKPADVIADLRSLADGQDDALASLLNEAAALLESA